MRMAAGLEDPTTGKVLRNPAPLVGQHSREILEGFGFSGDDIDALPASKAVSPG